MKHILTAAYLALIMTLGGCSGYKLGNVQSAALKDVHTIYVPVVINRSVEPGLNVMTTNAILRRIDNDGTFASARTKDADSELTVTIVDVTRLARRQSREDVTLTSQYEVTIEAKVTFTNRITGKRIFTDRPVQGKTTYYFQGDMQEAERQYLPVAADDLAYNIVKLVSEGW